MLNLISVLLFFGSLENTNTRTNPETAVELVLEIRQIAPTEGALMIGVYTEESWIGGAPVAGIRVDIEEDSLSVSVGTLPAGRYGVKMFHDVNGNGELDMNLIGIPQEPFAFSNNARVRFALPSWSAVSFELTENAATHSIDFR